MLRSKVKDLQLLGEIVGIIYEGEPNRSILYQKKTTKSYK